MLLTTNWLFLLKNIARIMIYLIIVSLIWAFSFGIIKNNLTEHDPNLISFLRLFISFIVFLPFLRIKKIERKTLIQFVGIGAVQFGAMYLAYIYSYQYLAAYEIALLTIFTPIYITIINDLLNKKFSRLFLLTAFLATVGAAVVKYKSINSDHFFEGFILVQISNVCFAVGQVLYTRVKGMVAEKSNVSIFALLYFGAALLSGIFSLVTTDYSNITFSGEQIFSLVYLGVIASGLAFFLWNVGATKVNKGALAIFNNLKIPLAIAVSLLVFNESADITRLLIGGTIIIAALFINEKYKIKTG